MKRIHWFIGGIIIVVFFTVAIFSMITSFREFSTFAIPVGLLMIVLNIPRKVTKLDKYTHGDKDLKEPFHN